MKTFAARVSVFVAVAALAVPAVASAHAHALRTSPAKDATVKAPTEIHISFSEDVKPTFTGADVAGPGGAVVKTGVATYDDTRREMNLPVTGPLKPGAYTVKWHAVAGDGHRSTGEFGFTVAP